MGFARPINSTMCSQSSGVTLVVSRFLLAPIPLSKDAAHLRFSFYPAYQIILVSVSFLHLHVYRLHIRKQGHYTGRVNCISS